MTTARETRAARRAIPPESLLPGMADIVIVAPTERPVRNPPTKYRPVLTIDENLKGVLDIDTVKGCTMGMRARPDGGCYAECYANKIAERYGRDFGTSVSRKIIGREHRATLLRLLNERRETWYRIGVAGDPCHDWANTCTVINALRHAGKAAVIITKHWMTLTDAQLAWLAKLNVVFNTSTSGFDTDAELAHRVRQIERIRDAGIKSVNRIVTANYGDTEWGRAARAKQDYLLTITPVIDNPLRVSANNPHVLAGDIIVSKRRDSVGGGTLVSVHAPTAYLGKCSGCLDQCGLGKEAISATQGERRVNQLELIPQKVEFLYVPTVIGSGYEADVAKLALEDGIAQRAARKNMQIHSAIILLIDDAFAGFFTFQNNHDVREFCLLQSVIRPELFTKDLYGRMVLEVVAQNTAGYPAFITTDPKSKFETPALFESLGFVTYLKMGGFCYMIRGDIADSRMKLLAHITMTNVWNSTGGDWLRLKKEWKARIDAAGAANGIEDPSFATRKGCWQGESGFSNVVVGRSHNGNASVLDPVACEVILRFFMPRDGRRVYNPFGGGVQMGYITGAYGYEYLASEIRQNQVDANNAICSEFPGVKWVQADSSTYEPGGAVDLVFACPPYYRVERYVDYDGNPPDGEINSMSTYAEFRDTLFAGYRKAIDALRDGGFFVIMTGDSRDNKGAYWCSEAETELFMRDAGLSVYNRIVYREQEFTRLAQAKKTLNMRKFPKVEQKIIVGYKGDIAKIKEAFVPVGRL